MVEPYNVLAGSQTDINRRLLRMIEELQESNGSDDSTIQSDIDDLKSRVKALEDAE